MHEQEEAEIRERKYQNKLAIFFFSLLIILLGLLAYTQEVKAETIHESQLESNNYKNVGDLGYAQQINVENGTFESLTVKIIGSLPSDCTNPPGQPSFCPAPIWYLLSQGKATEDSPELMTIVYDWDTDDYTATSVGTNVWELKFTADSYFMTHNEIFDVSRFNYFIAFRNTGNTLDENFQFAFDTTSNYTGWVGSYEPTTQHWYTVADYITVTGDFWFDIEYTLDETQTLTINTPSTNEIFNITDINATTKEIPISGYCPHNGEDQLLITNNLYCRYTYAEDYNIDCVDNEYTATTTMQFLGSGYPYQIMIMDRSFSLAGQLLNGACVVGTDENGQPEDWAGRKHVDINLYQDLEYNLQITSPTSTTGLAFVVQPSQNFPFNFSYNIKENYIGDEFVLVEMADDNYSSSTREIMGGFLSDLDRMRSGNLWSQENLLDYTEPGIIAENNVIKYYTVLIANASSTPTTLSRINFSVEGDTESLIFDTNQSGVGTWCSDPDSWSDSIFTEALKKSFCWLFVGNAKNKALDLKNTTQLLFENKIPFAYWSKFEEEWNSPRTQGNKKIIFNLDEFDAFDNDSPLNNFEIEIFDFENPGWTEAHWKVFNFLEDIVIPIWASVWVLIMAFNFFYRLSK